jgi:hypothetical protein
VEGGTQPSSEGAKEEFRFLPDAPVKQKLSPTNLTHSRQREFSPHPHKEIPLQLVKIDVSVFQSATSRVVRRSNAGNAPSQDFSYKSFRRKIFPPTHWRSRFCRELSHTSHDKPNEIKILGQPIPKKNVGIYSAR